MRRKLAGVVLSAAMLTGVAVVAAPTATAEPPTVQKVIAPGGCYWLHWFPRRHVWACY